MIRLNQLLQSQLENVNPLIMEQPEPADNGSFKDLGPDIFNVMNKPHLTSNKAISSYQLGLSGFAFNSTYTIATKKFYGKTLRLTWFQRPQSFYVNYGDKYLGKFNTITFSNWLSNPNF